MSSYVLMVKIDLARNFYHFFPDESIQLQCLVCLFRLDIRNTENVIFRRAVSFMWGGYYVSWEALVTSVKRPNNQLIKMKNNRTFTRQISILRRLYRPLTKKRQEQTEQKNLLYQTESLLFLLRKASTLPRPFPLISNHTSKHEGLPMFSHSISVFPFIKPEWVEGEMNPSVRDDEHSRDLPARHDKFAWLNKMLPKMRRETMVRNVLLWTYQIIWAHPTRRA